MFSLLWRSSCIKSGNRWLVNARATRSQRECTVAPTICSDSRHRHHSVLYSSTPFSVVCAWGSRITLVYQIGWNWRDQTRRRNRASSIETRRLEMRYELLNAPHTLYEIFWTLRSTATFGPQIAYDPQATRLRKKREQQLKSLRGACALTIATWAKNIECDLFSMYLWLEGF